MNLLYVAIGSAVGGMCRYGLSQVLSRTVGGVFPFGTFAVNLIGCLIIGLLFGCIDRGIGMSAEIRLLLITGFCGGFTTFSTFAHENYLLFGNEKGILIVCLYAALSFFGGLVMVYAGHRLSCLL